MLFRSTLRVTIEPTLIEGINHHIAFVVDGEQIGLHVRNGVAVPTNGIGASSTAMVSRENLIAVLSNRKTWSDCVREGSITITGDAAAIDTIRTAFEVDGLRS